MLVRDADGAYCETCGVRFNEATNWTVPWGWRNSQWMHERGTGHTMRLYQDDHALHPDVYRTEGT